MISFLVAQTGYAVTPYFRFLVKSGDWVWMQVEAILHCKPGTSIPLFYEYKARVLRYGQGCILCGSLPDWYNAFVHSHHCQFYTHQHLQNWTAYHYIHRQIFFYVLSEMVIDHYVTSYVAVLAHTVQWQKKVNLQMRESGLPNPANQLVIRMLFEST